MKEILQKADEWLRKGRDIGIPRHSDAVAWLAERFAPFVGADRELAYLVGKLHDVGKVVKEVLEVLQRNRGKSLTEEDWIIVKKHPSLGITILERWERELGCKVGPLVKLGVLYHHVWWNEKGGYPLEEGFFCLGQEEKDFISLIKFADTIASMYGPLFSPEGERTYKKERGLIEIVDELHRISGTELNDTLVTEFSLLWFSIEESFFKRFKK